MAKIDQIKEEIGWLKVIFGILTAIDISLLGWLVQNIESTTLLLQITAIIFIIAITIGIIVVNKKAYKKMRELKDL